MQRVAAFATVMATADRDAAESMRNFAITTIRKKESRARVLTFLDEEAPFEWCAVVDSGGDPNTSWLVRVAATSTEVATVVATALLPHLARRTDPMALEALVALEPTVLSTYPAWHAALRAAAERICASNALPSSDSEWNVLCCLESLTGTAQDRLVRYVVSLKGRVRSVRTMQMLVRVIARHALHKLPYFLVHDGALLLLAVATSDECMHLACARMLTELLDDRDTHGVVAFAPILLDGLAAMATSTSSNEALATLARALVRTCGTQFAVRLAKEEEEGKTIVKALMASHVRGACWTSEDMMNLFLLWPMRMANLAGTRSIVFENPTTAHECPITCECCTDPVVASDGFTYERDAILTYLLHGNRTSPMTREPLHPVVVPNAAIVARLPYTCQS